MFRKTALDHLSSPEQLDQTVRVTSPAGWLALVTLLLLLAFGAAWSVIVTAPETVVAKGIVISPGGVLDVVASTEGRISRFAVTTGSWIKTGEVVATIAQPDMENALADARSRLAEAKQDFAKLLDFQASDTEVQRLYAEQKRDTLRQQMAFAKDRLKWLLEREAIQKNLLAKGLLQSQKLVDTRIEINAAREDYATAQNALRQVDIEENTLGITQERERLEQEAEIAKLRRETAFLEDRLRRNTQITSPYGGYVMELKVNGGEVVESGQALFSMLPREHDDRPRTTARPSPDLRVKLYVPAERGKKITNGMEAQISPSTVKREEYGFIQARVVDVAAIPSTEEGMMRVLKNRQLVQELSGGSASLEVTVALEPDPNSTTGYKWSSSTGPPAPVNPGTLAEGTITVRRIRVISILIPALEHLFGPTGG